MLLLYIYYFIGVNKNMKKTFKVTGATAGTVLVALSQISPAFADEVAAKKNTVDVKSEKLDAVAKEAAELGFTSTTKKEQRVAKTQEEFEKLQSEAKAELDELASKIQKNVDADKQHKAKVKEAVDKVKTEEDEIKAQYPLLAEKDGVRVYGKFNEEARGSQEYYKDIHVFADDTDGLSFFKDGVYIHDDSQFVPLEGDKQTSVTSGTGKWEATYNSMSGDDSNPKGTKVKITHVADTTDGRQVDVIVSVPEFDFQGADITILKQINAFRGKPGTTDGYLLLTKWHDPSWKGVLGVYSSYLKGLDLNFQFVDKDNNPVESVTTFVHTDIDYGQGISVFNTDKIVDLVPKNTLKAQKLTVDGRTYDVYSDFGQDRGNINNSEDVGIFNEESSIPDGSFATVIKGSSFTWRHNSWRGQFFNTKAEANANGNTNAFVGSEYDADRLAYYKEHPDGNVHMYADIFGKGAKINLHTPEIPTAPAIEKDFELKEIEVSLEQQPTTTYVDENGKQLLPPEKGEKDKKDIPGYKFVETKKKENGDIEHVYKKIANITTYVDENGKVLLPPKEGIHGKETINGYEFVKTNNKENGDVEHVYRQIKHITTYVDESGKELLPQKEGIHEKETINGYEFVKTNNKENGDVEHVYRQVKNITTYVDVNGKVLLPPKEGIHEKETIDGYEFVKTNNKENGDVEHIYKQVETPTPETPTTETPTTSVVVEKKAPTTKKLPNTGVGIIGGIAGVLGLTGVGAYFNTRKRKK